jgi:hypothetical protein
MNVLTDEQRAERLEMIKHAHRRYRKERARIEFLLRHSTASDEEIDIDELGERIPEVEEQ